MTRRLEQKSTHICKFTLTLKFLNPLDWSKIVWLMKLSFPTELQNTNKSPHLGTSGETFYPPKQWLYFMPKDNQTTCILCKVGSHPYNLPHLREYINHQKQSNYYVVGFFIARIFRDKNNVYKSYLWLTYKKYISGTC